MKTIDIEESRHIQMDILTYIDQFCSEHNIVYSIAYGTLLGAIRHKGFIPWDDDIDICMLRDDYERFVNMFDKADTGMYKIGEYSVSDSWSNPFAKIYDDRTTLIHKQARSVKMGVFVDVFPFDKVSTNMRLFHRDRRLRNFYKRIIQVKIASLKTDKGWIKNAFYVFVEKILFSIIPMRWVISKWDKLAQRYNDTDSTFVLDNCIGLIKQPLSISLFDNIVYYHFEDRLFKGFADADQVLKATYGDYMTLPPEKDRVNKHDYYAFWNTLD